MRFTDVVAASLVAPLVTAHGGIEGAPKLFGLPKELRRGNPFAGHHGRHAAAHLIARQGGNAEGRCGPEGGGASCAAGFCCSASGYCGTTKEHCAAPDCLIDFGPACDANKTPAGESTANDVRPQLGNIAYGGLGIRSCVQPGVVAITYDDGPYIYTEEVMAKFEARGGRATFFITGNNIGKGAIDENWRDVITKMDANGHQIASHTWSHQNLDAITQQQRLDQMTKNEMALRNIIGKYPTYMRPPYSACESTQCQSDLEKLGYVVTSFDLDTDDYNQLTPEKIQVAKNNFKDGIDREAHLAIGHDIHQLTALNLTDYMLDYVYSNGLKAVTVGECMNDPVANWYRSSTPAPAPSPSSSAPVPSPTGPPTTDGTCGTSGKGQTCIGFVQNDGLLGECCSQYGYCGNTDGHCSTSSGCQLGFGKCGAQPSAAPSTSKADTTTGPVPTPTGPTSTDGQCGTAANGQSCIGFNGPDGLSECCSSYGWCGNSAAHCSAGCQAGFGKCGEQNGISSGNSVSVSNRQLPSSSAESSSASIVLPSFVLAPTETLVATEAQVSTSLSVSEASSSAAVSKESYPSDFASETLASLTPNASASATYVESASAIEAPSATASPSVSDAPTPVYTANTLSTLIKPSASAISTPCSSSLSSLATPTPSPSAQVSKDGTCGDANGGQTCAGYKNSWGISMGCCCKTSGKCSVDPWACGVGCDKGFGKCWY